MKIHELYINDIPMDLDKDVNIYPKYQSPIFTDISRIVSNVTNNISLPLTPNNAKAINMYHLADKSDPMNVYNSFPRRWHDVRYYRNGIPICEEGRGIMMSIEEGRINFAFTWGNIDNFKKLEDKNLNDLTFNDVAIWGIDTRYVTTENANYGFYDIDFGAGGGSRFLEWQHPCVNSNFIIKKIAEENGIKINNLRNSKPITDNLLIPCLTKFGDNRIGEMAKNVYVSESNTLELGRIVPKEGSAYTDPLKIWDNQSREFNVSNIARMRVTLSAFRVKLIYQGYKPTVELIIGDHRIPPYKEEDMGGGYEGNEVRYNFNPVDVSVNTSGMNGLNIRITERSYDQTHNFIYEQPTVRIVAYMNECEYRDGANAYFPLAINLPEIKQVDFLRAIFQMNGLFAYSKSPNTIDLLSIDDIRANVASAYDWTDKLVNRSDNFSAPMIMEFKFSDFTQKNTFKYDNDEEITTEGSGVITVNNKTLSAEPKNVVELPFSQTGKRIDSLGAEYAYIPIYHISTDADDKSTDGFDPSLTPRILRFKPNSGGKATFDGLDWKSILKNKYTGYQGIMKTPRVLSVQCRLSDVELSGLDFSKPVTFAQFGNYYAILKIESSADGLCDCELIEIKNI